MAFDPSIISQIPDMAPNPVAAREQGLRLADMQTAQQAHALGLKQQQQEYQDNQRAREILRGAKLDNPRDVTRVAEKMNQEGLTDQSMQFMKLMQSLQSGKGELQLQQYQIQAAKTGLMADSAAALVNQYDSYIQQGKTPAEAAGLMQPRYQQAIQQLGQQRLPDGSPALGPQDIAQINQNPQFDVGFMRNIAWRSEQSRKALETQLKFHKDIRDESAEKDKEKRTQVLEDRLYEQERENRKRDAQRDADEAKKGQHVETIIAPDKKPHRVLFDAQGKQVKDLGETTSLSASANLSGREAMFMGRIISAGEEASTALENITELPITTSSGVLGLGPGKQTTIYSSARDALRNKLSSQEVQDYGTMISGVRRNLAAIEASGLAPQGALTESMASVELRAGDSQLTKLRKLAEIRQIVEKGLTYPLKNPRVPDETKQEIQGIIDRMRQAVPFTQHDLTQLQRKWQKNPKATLRDVMPKESSIDASGAQQGNAPTSGWGQASVVTPP